MWRLLLSLLLLYLVPAARTASAAISSAGSLSGFRAAISQQNLQTVLMSIEERLRGLDNLYSARYAPRLDLSMEQQARRLDSMESRLGRLETLLELRLDKISETLSARQLKEELSKDQLSRKLDSNYERLNHRLGYMEARLDMGITKLQTSVEAGSSRVERLEMALGGRHGDVGADMSDVKNSLDELKRGFQGCHNTTMTAVASGESAIKQYYDRLSSSLVQIHGELNRTLVQNDGTLPVRRDDDGHLLTSMERHVNNFGTKITNMYNELWRRTQVLEALSKDSMSLSNATRRELQDGLRSMSVQINRYCCLQNDRSKSSSLDMTLESLGGSVSDVSRKLDTYFQTLITTHDVILENCHRIQKEEPLIEERLTDVLERIIDISSSNRCHSVSKELQEVHELLKSHHTTVVRNVGHSTNTVMRAADNSSKDTKNLVEVIAEVRDGLMASNKDIHTSLASVRQEQENVNEVLEKIVSTLQEFNEQLTEINAASLFGEQSEESNTNITFCPDSKKIAADLAEQLHHMSVVPPTGEQVSAFIKELKDKGILLLTEPSEKLNRSEPSVSRRNISNETENSSSIEENQNNDNISEEYDDDDDDDDDNDDTNPEDLENEILKTTRRDINQSQIIQTSNLNITNVNKFNITEFGTKQETTEPTKERLESSSSVTDNEKDFKSAEVTIKIIPQSHLELDNSSSLFEIDLNHVAAIIHGNDQQRPQASVTIVHNDKGITPEGQVKYSSTLIEPPAELILNPSALHNFTQNDIKIFIVPETKFDDKNTSTFKDSQTIPNSSQEYNNSSKIPSSNLIINKQDNLHFDEANVTEQDGLLSVPLQTTASTSERQENLLKYSNNDNHIVSVIQNETQSINSDVKKDTLERNNGTQNERENTDIHTKEVLKNALDFQGGDMNSSKTIQDLWRTILLQDAFQKVQNGSHHTINYSNNSAEGTSATSYAKFLEHGSPESNISNKTDNGILIRHYVSKLEELASRLARIGTTTIQNSTTEQHEGQENYTSKEVT
ncbi:putative leucine-rich repeat-containing protein DDB_G0290503 isoform X2 [Anabrus simplex]|uniref:putative leucine-rich repeat-containing protein DDB_G0290503 isoform X2 n=1 Tax=Anabrus simplex TaxID=316456 RepID=UPI0035A3C6E5